MNELFEVFEKLGLPYFRQGTLSDDEYPNSFFTFDNFDSQNGSFYDNSERRYSMKVNVYFYTNDPRLVYSKMNEFIEASKSKGFIVEGRGKDAPSGKQEYVGRYVTINVIHRL